MMARNTIVPFKGRIQKRKTNHLHIVIFGLQRGGRLMSIVSLCGFFVRFHNQGTTRGTKRRGFYPFCSGFRMRVSAATASYTNEHTSLISGRGRRSSSPAGSP